MAPSEPLWKNKRQSTKRTYVGLYMGLLFSYGEKGMCPPSNPRSTFDSAKSYGKKHSEDPPVCLWEDSGEHLQRWGGESLIFSPRGKLFFMHIFFFLFFLTGGWLCDGGGFLFEVCSLTPNGPVFYIIKAFQPFKKKQSSMWKCQKTILSVIVLCAEETIDIPKLYNFRIRIYPKNGLGFLNVLLYLFMW